MALDETLKARGALYGDFYKSCMVDVKIIEAIDEHHREVNNVGLTIEQIVILTKVTHKLARIAGTFDHVDSWHDLAGYAQLIEKHFINLSREEEIPY